MKASTKPKMNAAKAIISWEHIDMTRRTPLLTLSTRLGRVIGWTAVLPFAIWGTSPSWADNCTGYDVLTVAPSDTTDLGQGMKLTRWKAQSVLLSNDSIYNLLVGECGATILQNPDGKTQVAGNCARRDRDGNTESDAWSQAPGADKGQWNAAGGTGKYAGRQDSGWYQQVYADAKVIVSRWGGDWR